jgi:ABC-type glutathione transport system ATPase component
MKSLELLNLCVSTLRERANRSPVLSGVSVAVARAEIFGALLESGSGESTLGSSTFGLLDASAKTEKGIVRFEGDDLMRANASELRRIHRAVRSEPTALARTAAHKVSCVRYGGGVDFARGIWSHFSE